MVAKGEKKYKANKKAALLLGRLKCTDTLFCFAFLPVNATQGVSMVG